MGVPVLWVATSVLAAGLSSGAYAATASAGAAADTGGLEEIVVTARYTTESVQDSPLAISALSSEMLEARGVEQVADVAASIPNVTFVPSSGNMGKSVTAFVRGIGQADSSFAFNPAVGFYLDDVYIGAITGANLDLVDVQSVDVLRGPQGTLFGANTESGAVQIHSVKPKGDNSGYASLGYGSYRHVKVSGGFDIPLVDDKLFLRVAGMSDKQDGYQKVYDFVCLHPGQSGTLPQLGTKANGCQTGTQGGNEVIGGRAALRWLVADNLEINLAADLTNDTGEAPASTLIAINDAALNAPAPFPFTGYNLRVAIPNFGIPFDSRFIPADPYVSYTSRTDPVTHQQFSGKTPLLNYGYSGTINWDIANDLHLKSVTAYRSSNGWQYTDNSQAPLTVGISDQYVDRRQFSEEINLTGKAFSDTLEWAAGVFYYNADGTLVGDIDLPAAPGGPHFIVDEQIKDENKSAFLHAIYHFTDKLGLELGVRYTDQSKTFTIGQTPLNVFATALVPTPIESRSKRWDPKISVQYQWTPDFMTYAAYATGFKGGGVNPYVVLLPEELTPFGPETMKNYEVGAKSEWFNRHLRVNGAVFQMDYNDLQEQINLATAPLPQYVNVGKARLKGIELEVEARAGDFSLNASGSYLDYKTVSCGVACISYGQGGTVPDDGVAPYTPKTKFNAGVQYAFNTGSGTFTPRLDYSYQSKVFFDTTNDPRASQKGYGVANLRLMWSDAGDKWSGQVAVTNLFDKFYYVNMANFLTNGLGTLYGTPSAPRQVMFTMKRKF
ncbi:MAG: TonB-dependent receptor [Steroidobacteraceae bacterium]